MANTTVRGRHAIGNFPSNTGVNVITDRIIRMPGIQAVTPQMIRMASPSKVEESQRIRWRTEDPQPNVLTINGAVASGDGTLVADEIDLVQVGQVLLTPNDENIRVDSIDSGTNTATITRGVNGTTAAAIADNAEVLIMPQTLKATEQAGYTPTQYGEFRQNNFAQLGWRMSQDYWSTATPSYMLEPEERNRLEEAKQKFLQNVVMRQLEVMQWYGSAAQMSDSVRGSFDGIVQFIDVHTSASVGDLTVNAILDHVNEIRKDRGLMPDGSMNVRLFGNSLMLSIVDALWRSYYTNYSPAEVAITPNVMANGFKSHFGTLEFVVVDQLRDGELYGVDMNDIEMVPLNPDSGPGGGWLEFMQGPENLGILAEEWHYFFRGSLKLGHPRNHFKMTGITTTPGNYPGFVGATSS